MITDKNGRELIVSVSGKYQDDIQIDSLEYRDSDEEVSEEVYDYVMDNYGDVLYELWYQDKICEAESRYEGDR